MKSCHRYSAAALLAILFALPFAWRVLEHRDLGRWESSVLAFYHAHLELFLGNGCLGVGVIMLLALTLERYVSVCHPGHARPLLGPPSRAVALIPLATFLLYLPAVFRSRVTACTLYPSGSYLYQRQDVPAVVEHPLFKVYTVVLELVFKVIPIILLAVLNLRILLVYRKSCERRRRMTLSRTTSGGDDDPRKFAEERRLMLLLGSTSILFLVCVSPMVILNVTLSEVNLTRYPYQRHLTSKFGVVIACPNLLAFVKAVNAARFYLVKGMKVTLTMSLKLFWSMAVCRIPVAYRTPCILLQIWKALKDFGNFCIERQAKILNNFANTEGKSTTESKCSKLR
ncbi:hypothetical protein FQR65_LT00464 [Abscondita terminalis]|nr:hypothetical protein FQR65_LT00464 [Abscondita terminalis]